MSVEDGMGRKSKPRGRVPTTASCSMIPQNVHAKSAFSQAGVVEQKVTPSAHADAQLPSRLTRNRRMKCVSVLAQDIG